MAFIESAMSSIRSLLRSPGSLLSVLPCAVTCLRRSTRSFRSFAPLQSHQRASPDIKDSGVRQPRSPFQQFRSGRALSVSDMRATEWCEKQTEFVLRHGKPAKTVAMKAGCDRHTELEEEVMEKVEICIKSSEEHWAVKFMKFIVGAKQLLFRGMTRELQVFGIVEGIWMVGVIDEIHIPLNEAVRDPLLIDTKTRYRATLPSEAQKRNARFQLMCYKYLWDTVVADGFPARDFFHNFDLDPHYVLSEDVRQYSGSLGFRGKTLRDVVSYLRDTCCKLLPSQEKLLLRNVDRANLDPIFLFPCERRYESQADRSLLEEYYFAYDDGWFKSQIVECLKFWSGEREANFVSKDERWKCYCCDFAATCPANTSNSGVRWY